VPNVKKIRGLNLPGTPWATSACCGMTFTLYLTLYIYIYNHHWLDSPWWSLALTFTLYLTLYIYISSSSSLARQPLVDPGLGLYPLPCLIYIYHHHHWLDNPWWTLALTFTLYLALYIYIIIIIIIIIGSTASWWALAFLRSFVHSSLLKATFFQFLTPNILMS